MVAVDTNIVVRLLTQDDEQQYRKSFELFQKQDIFIPDTVILEAEWVLRFVYQFQLKQICQALRNLFGLPNVYFTNTNAIVLVLQWHENDLDFADAFHLAQSQSCSAIYTFDEKFMKRAKKLLTQCVVKQPE
ncbi:type II toxin-antitoxin system VapC family toxin [Chroococcidiopsis sp.]|uniref:type II toxin-antitoxin system VapC family toxin n=1 Tax=Chroococcidiopsis sp. TaxID=3088168 RepID=UPI003F3F3C23